MNELDIQIEYTKRNFEWFKAMCYVAINDGPSRAHAANNYARFMRECNDTLDSLLRRRYINDQTHI